MATIEPVPSHRVTRTRKSPTQAQVDRQRATVTAATMKNMFTGETPLDELQRKIAEAGNKVGQTIGDVIEKQGRLKNIEKNYGKETANHIKDMMKRRAAATASDYIVSRVNPALGLVGAMLNVYQMNELKRRGGA